MGGFSIRVTSSQDPRSSWPFSAVSGALWVEFLGESGKRKRSGVILLSASLQFPSQFV